MTPPAAALAWSRLETAPGAAASPADLPREGPWHPAAVPGTVARDLQTAQPGTPLRPLHGSDFWYRCTAHGHGPHVLHLDGLATLTDVFINGRAVAHSTSMFLPLRIPLDLNGPTELHLAFRSLTHHLQTLKPPRARWRVAMVPQQALRAVRTTLLGHMPSWSPPIDTVGPWQAVKLLPAHTIQDVRLNARRDLRGTGHLRVQLRADHPALASATVSCAGVQAPLHATGSGTWVAELVLPGIAPWWPRGLGPATLHDVHLHLACSPQPPHAAPPLPAPVVLGRTGFRHLHIDTGGDGSGFALRVNGVPVFARGAVWTPPDPLHPGGDAGVPQRLHLLADMGANLLRVAGPFCSEGPTFHATCDALGLMVWHDLMLANFDHPWSDPVFAGTVEAETRALLERLGGSPSLVVLCGGSEVHQQAAMLGLPPERRQLPFFEDRLPELVAHHGNGCAVLPNSPWGGTLPFSVREGVSHCFGVGAYERPLDDARRSAPRFAAECLAFAQVPDPITLDTLGLPAVHHPQWKTGVPRDRGASWDFEDTRDHYLQRVFGLDPAALRRTDPSRYLAASRAVVAHVIAATLAEWRRPGSPTAGALVFTAGDLQPGAGWGLVDHLGEPKSGFHGFRQVAQPLALGLTDEGCDGLDLHLLNDGPEPVALDVQVQVLRHGHTEVASGRAPVVVPAHGGCTHPLQSLLGGFLDLAYAFRFGPPGHDTVVVTAHPAQGEPLQACHFPLGPWTEPAVLGLQARVLHEGPGWWLELATGSTARFVHIDDRHHRPADNHFHLPPGPARRVRLWPRGTAHPTAVPEGVVTALNAHDTVAYRGTAA